MVDATGLDVNDLARDTVDAVLMEGQGRPPMRPTGWTLWQPRASPGCWFAGEA
jgi:hypothetical protein